MTTHLTKLHKFIVNYYSLDELNILCFELNVEYENLNGRTRNTKARDLILHIGQAQRFPELFNKLEVSRPRAYEQANFDTDQNTFQPFYNELEAFKAETEPFTEKILKRVGLEQRVGFVLVAIVTIMAMWLLYNGLRDTGPKRMGGEFNIAVAPFQVIGTDPERGEDVANSIYSRLHDNLEDIKGSDIKAWGPGNQSPNSVPSITGQTPEARANTAHKLAQEIDADMVVFGTVDASSGNWKVTPEFFISDRRLQEAEEIVGQYRLGEPIFIRGNNPGALRLAAGERLQPRSEILAKLAVGLTFYSICDYGRALQEFKQLEQDFEQLEEDKDISPPDDTGINVLYLVLGNTLGKMASPSHSCTTDNEIKFDLVEANSLLNEAIDYYDKALAIDPTSARPYSGKSSAAYLLALNGGSNGSQIDMEQLGAAIENGLNGLDAPVKPPYSQVEAKLHLNLGQSYLLLAWVNDKIGFDHAINEFQQVLDAYESLQGDSEVLRELAAEAHARLGYVFACSGDEDKTAQAIAAYQEAIKLSNDRSSRQKLFQDNVDELQATGTHTNCLLLSN